MLFLFCLVLRFCIALYFWCYIRLLGVSPIYASVILLLSADIKQIKLHINGEN